jgi:CzcA family heavy metal efflux pump
MSNIQHRGGMAAWSIRHPIGIVMLTLAVIILGLFSMQRLSVDLLPHIIYPDIRVRIIDQGVPAAIMEDRVTRQLEEQLSITENAISVESTTSEGRSAVNLSFNYGTDIDVALRDASTRLDRAKRFLPTTIDPPVIYKRDPSQRPVLTYVVSSRLRDPVSLRNWVDNVFGKWLLNTPGVAAAEVGGGLEREIQVLPDQKRLAGLGLTTDDIITALKKGNLEAPAGRIHLTGREISSRIAARYQRIEDIRTLPIKLPDGSFIQLKDVARIIDTHKDEKLRIRLDGTPGVKLSIQKQPEANTVAVVDALQQRLKFLRQQNQIPDDIQIRVVNDQSIFVRRALNNATTAAVSGALLAMIVVYLFLGDIRRTLIIGTAIPVAMTVTFTLMDLGGLTLNIMTLGGLAVGIGMLVDSTIVMLENIFRHQQHGEGDFQAGQHAAVEVNSAIVASTSTNLAAIIPFLFISGLIGLLFKELIFTVTAAMVAAMLVALTLVPALATRVHSTRQTPVRALMDRIITSLQSLMDRLLKLILNSGTAKGLTIVLFIAGLALASLYLTSLRQDFLPNVDEGEINIRLTTDPGVSLNVTDKLARRLEALIRTLPSVESVYTTSGGFVFGRSEYEAHNKASLTVTLKPLHQRSISTAQWVALLHKKVREQQFVGTRIRITPRRGLRLPIHRGSDAVSLRIQGDDIKTLEKLAGQLTELLQQVSGLRNIGHSLEETRQEIAIRVDRQRAATLGVTADDVSRVLRTAINGTVTTEFIDGDRSFDIRVRLPLVETNNIQQIESLLLFHTRDKSPVYVSDVASVELLQAPASIRRDNQRRIVEVSASIKTGVAQSTIDERIKRVIGKLRLPDGYSIYDAGASRTLREGQSLAGILLALAVFMVFVIMAIQYESLRNPLVILFSIPFALTGVAIGLKTTGLPLTMPVWLGLIMLAGIVVNNAIVLVEYIEILRREGQVMQAAILDAVKLRLRPILMTSLTTIAGLAPLALALGEGAEMLQPLATTIVFGLSFSLLVSLVLVPVIYQLLHHRTAIRQAAQ